MLFNDPLTNGVWYRYEEVVYSPGVDEYGDRLSGPGHLEVKLREIPVISLTPKGAWLRCCRERHYLKEKTFVRLEANKRFACPTIEEAKASFLARKRKQIRILSAQLKRAEEAIMLIENDGKRSLFFKELVHD